MSARLYALALSTVTLAAMNAFQHILRRSGASLSARSGIRTGVALCLLFRFAAVAPAEGVAVDRNAYNRRLREIVEASCKEFAKAGVNVDPARLEYPENEIVDSFLNGREFYRDFWGRSLDLSEKLGWLRDLFGVDYPRLEAEWKSRVATRNGNPGFRLSKEEIARRLDAIEAATDPPLRMHDGSCMSTSGYFTVDSECIHCGRPLRYDRLGGLAPDMPPSGFLHMAKMLKAWGVEIELDGRAACPSCCTNGTDFKLSEVPFICRLDENADFSQARADIRSIPAGVDLLVLSRRDWGKDGQRFDLRCTSSGREIFTVPQEFLKVTKTCTASALGDIPPTWFSFEGRRFKLDEWHARALLAFAQGYTTVLGGPFGSHNSLKPAVPWLREVLLGNPASGAAASGSPDGSALP